MRVRLTENQLHRIVVETVKRVVNEIGDTPRGQKAIGMVGARADFRAADAQRKLDKAEREGDFDNYDTHFRDMNRNDNLNGYALQYAEDKRKEAGREEVGRDKRFKDEFQRKRYTDMMDRGFDKGLLSYNHVK